MSKAKGPAATFVFKHPIWFLAILCGVGAIVLRMWAHVIWRWNIPGEFGDAFAPIVGLITSAALAAAVLSTFLQREELQNQREDNEEAREEAKQHRKATEALTLATMEANLLKADELRHGVDVLFRSIDKGKLSQLVEVAQKHREGNMRANHPWAELAKRGKEGPAGGPN